MAWIHDGRLQWASRDIGAQDRIAIAGFGKGGGIGVANAPGPAREGPRRVGWSHGGRSVSAERRGVSCLRPRCIWRRLERGQRLRSSAQSRGQWPEWGKCTGQAASRFRHVLQLRKHILRPIPPLPKRHRQPRATLLLELYQPTHAPASGVACPIVCRALPPLPAWHASSAISPSPH